jgi:hypothetical protein
MSKTRAALFGGIVGTVAALAVAYLFGPAPDTTYDASYRSRLDDALDEGRKAAQEHEERLIQQYKGLRIRSESESK